jgi:nitrogen fixation protein NifU and related proteins
MAGNLYNDAIIAEAKANHAHGRLADAATSVTCDNPLCGDRVTIDLSPLAGGRIGELAHRTRGCLLTQASASVIGRHAAGATPEQVQDAADGLRRLLAGEPVDPAWPELAMFAPVSAVRSRHECVLLPFEALAEALRRAGSA